MVRNTCAIPVAFLSPAKGLGLVSMRYPVGPGMHVHELFTCPPESMFLHPSEKFGRSFKSCEQEASRAADCMTIARPASPELGTPGVSSSCSDCFCSTDFPDSRETFGLALVSGRPQRGLSR